MICGTIYTLSLLCQAKYPLESCNECKYFYDNMWLILYFYIFIISMKKNTIKAFTLVEMLIVIVIIWILIASLMPRMQTAQWRARDVARKNDLSQIQTAIITSQSDRGAWPGMNKNNWTSTSDDANNALAISGIAQQLLDAWMSEIPSDPNGSNDNYWLWTAGKGWNLWQYIYMVAKRNWVNNAGFVLMAKTEVEWSSNWVTCSNQTAGSGYGYLLSTDDLAKVQLCKTITQVGKGDCASKTCQSNQETCCYDETADLRYIALY